MGDNKRKVAGGVLNHCYQRTKNGFVIFYNVSDFLVFYTIISVAAARHGVKVLKLCQMYDHIHHSTIVKRREVLAAFVSDYTSRFSFEHNNVCHSKGPFFDGPFGSAPKYTDKKIRSNLVYVDNNPVERKLCAHAEEYRWNYLAYAVSDHPFSERLVLSKASMSLRKSLKTVKRMHDTGRHLNYEMLQKMFKSLKDRAECEQLTDYIITEYAFIDHEAAAAYFGSYEKMLGADHTTTGSEYDIKETFFERDDRWYSKMTGILFGTGRFKDIHDIFALDMDGRWDLFQLLRSRTNAPGEQIAAYLRMPLKKS